MEREHFELTYGTSTKNLSVSKDRLAGPLVSPRPFPPSTRPVTDMLNEKLAAPDGRPQLRDMVRDKVVGIVISDEFRAGLQPQIAEVLMAEAAAGGPKEIRVFIATGTHDPAIYCRNLGPHVQEVAAGLDCPVTLFEHDCDKSDFVDLGQTSMGTNLVVEKSWMESEVRVYGHESKHHYMAGYSTIDKQIVPGVSARRTVEDNHKRSLQSGSGPGRSPWHAIPDRRNNPFSVDAKEARAITESYWLAPGGALVKRQVDTFGLDMISQGTDIFWSAAGDPGPMTSEMTGKADEVALIELEKCRYVVISPGGPPASQALYGVQNCFDMALLGAILQGGEALVIAPCDGRPDLPPDVSGLAPDGKAKELFWDNLLKLKEWPLDKCFEHINENFELYMWKTYRVLKNFKQDELEIHIHSELPDKTLREAGFIPAPDIDAWVREREARNDGLFRVIDGGNKLCIVGR